MPNYASVPTTTLADRIRQARGELSQTEFADRIGVDSITVSRWERGVVKPNGASIVALCREFGMTLDDFEQVA